MESLHKVSAGFVFAFLCLHMANHFVGLQGLDTHIAFMAVARMVYRHPVVEMVVLLAFLVQILTGWALAREIWAKKKDFVHQLQAASGTYIAFFVLTHVAFIFYVRQLLAVDSDIYVIVAGLMQTGWMYALIPYYGLAIFALFVHMGCILFDIFKKTLRPVSWGLLVVTAGIGGYATWLLMMFYTGHTAALHVPADYFDLYPLIHTK
ncbi:hypothetical protein [Asticcacaulis sp.]|uniref:hypothetical protein n=1 Tax=Asticcacaulis sp. TaxID=1872648 RepID=UPI002611A7E1|nr:hypothetical protein [Asticcacaulis sp.]